MKFVQGSKEDGVLAICERIETGLKAGEQVLWLVSGGSNIALEVQVMQQLHAHVLTELSRLTIMPMDERYGASGFPDSNTQQLREAGFDAGHATWIDVLANDLPLHETVDAYAATLTAGLHDAQLIVGQFGMGDDAHIAGIKPQSPATHSDLAVVVGYEWSDYTRMTLTAYALKQITVGYMPVYGDNKQPALERLQRNTEPYAILPAALLYELPEVYIYNDFIESEE